MESEEEAGAGAEPEAPEATPVGAPAVVRDVFRLIAGDADPDEDARERGMGISVERAARIGGLQAIGVTALAIPLLALVPPTVPLGAWGWLLSGMFAALVAGLGLELLRRPDVASAFLARSSAAVVGVIGIQTWLCGGSSSPFLPLLVLSAINYAPHPRAHRRLLLIWLAVVAVSPLMYEGWSDHYAARAAMIILASIGCSVTMIWLSARVGRSAAGLQDAAEAAQERSRNAMQVASRLRRLDEVRDRFISTASHELRTPLTSITSSLEALLASEAGEPTPEQRELLEIANRNSERIGALVDDLLLLSRAKAGHLTLDLSLNDVGVLIGKLSDDLRPIARERGIEIDVLSPPGLAAIVDPVRLEQAATNLISNAIKYTDIGGSVVVRVGRVNGEALVEVSDNGVGVPADEIDQIAERFVRASTAGDAVGTGLGLAIAREIVELHGGRLDAVSEAGVGSTFSLRLPLDGAPEPPSSPAPQR